MKNWFYKLIELEEKTGELYLNISKKIEDTDPDISEVFLNSMRMRSVTEDR